MTKTSNFHSSAQKRSRDKSSIKTKFWDCREERLSQIDAAVRRVPGDEAPAEVPVQHRRVPAAELRKRRGHGRGRGGAACQGLGHCEEGLRAAVDLPPFFVRSSYPREPKVSSIIYSVRSVENIKCLTFLRGSTVNSAMKKALNEHCAELRSSERRSSRP